jgi:hypothetical protein
MADGAALLDIPLLLSLADGVTEFWVSLPLWGRYLVAGAVLTGLVSAFGRWLTRHPALRRIERYPFASFGAEAIVYLSPPFPRQFDRPQTVWALDPDMLTRDDPRQPGREEYSGAEYQYSDRMQAARWQEAYAKACRRYGPDTPGAVESALQDYYARPALRLMHVLAGNRVFGDGHYLLFGYRIPDGDESTSRRLGPLPASDESAPRQEAFRRR